MKNIIYTTFLFLFLLASCTYVQKIQDGKTAVDRKQYDLALELLSKEYNKSKSRVEKGKIAFLLGESYKNTGQGDKAIEWYDIAYSNQYGSDALKEYAFALKRAQRYGEAEQAFKDLGFEIGSPYEYRKEIAATKVAAEWLSQTNPEYKISISDFNSKGNDYAPMPYMDHYLVFTSDRNNAVGDEKYKWTGADFSDLFIVDLETEEVRPFDFSINTEHNEGTAAFTSDYSGVYFTRCFDNRKLEDEFCKIMFSRREGERWTAPVMLNFIQEKINYRHPFLSPDGNTLYFSANDPEGWGGYDLYYSEKQSDGWSTPKLMPRTVNTVNGNEGFPFFDKDTLYFASDGHTSMGGLDIFKAIRKSDGTFTPVKNLKSPINTGADDFGYMVDYQSNTKEEKVISVGYFSSARGGSGDDIYRYQKVIPPPPPVQISEPEVVEYRNILKGYVLEKIYAEPNNPDSKVLGRKPLSNAQVQVDFGKKKLNFTTSDDGLFSIELEDETDYSFFAEKQDYLNNTGFFSSKGIGKDPENPVQTFEIEIELDKIFLNREITLENIYYDFDRAEIRTDAQPTLKELARNLNLNPDLNIQLASHTDCRGGDNYNQSLSQRRAQAAVDYLISLGINAERLQAIGYGEGKPKTDCLCSRCTEAEHQLNRRTTFAIVK